MGWGSGYADGGPGKDVVYLKGGGWYKSGEDTYSYTADPAPHYTVTVKNVEEVDYFRG